MIDANQLASMRATWNASLPSYGTITRRTEATDSAGGYTTTWVASGTVACRVAPGASGNEALIAQRLTAVSVWRVQMPAATDVLVSDRIATGGVTYEVQGVSAPHTWETGRTAFCVEVT